MAIEIGTLAYIRKLFVEETGRFDLVQDLTNYEDNGADFFINAGCKILDMKIDHPKSIMRFEQDLSEGQYMVNMKYLRSVERVEVSNEEGRTRLTQLSYGDFRDKYNSPMSELEKGRPTEFALNVNALSPELKAIGSADLSYDKDGLLFYSDDVMIYDGIIFAPPSNGVYTITVHGYFYSHLEDNNDKNFYSVNFPLLLVLASKLALYSMYDNTAGMNDVLGSIEVFIEGLDRNVINSEVARAGIKRKGL